MKIMNADELRKANAALRALNERTKNQLTQALNDNVRLYEENQTLKGKSE